MHQVAWAPCTFADIQTAAGRVLTTWACSMPVAAAQLVLVTAAEDHTLVGTEGFASSLVPLAASGGLEAERTSSAPLHCSRDHPTDAKLS